MGYKGLATLGSLGVGAGLFYLFDADKGKKRRTVVQKKALHLWRNSERAFDKISHDLTARAQDLAAEVTAARSNPVTSKPVNGNTLQDQVWSEIRHTLSNPGGIQVAADKGRVKLVGTVPKAEIPKLLARVSSIPGVTEMENRLKVRQPAEKANGRWLKPLIWTVAGSALAVCGSSVGAHKALGRS